MDSLPAMFPDTMSMLQNLLSGTPLAPEGCKWIRADMPKQGLGTMDYRALILCQEWLPK